MIRTGITGLCILLQLASFSQGRLSLADAVNIAMKNNPGIRIATNNVSISNVGNSYGFAGGLPIVSATASDNEQSLAVNQTLNTGTEIQRSGAASNAAALGVGATVLVYSGGRVIDEKKRLDVVEQQARFLLTSRGLNLIGNVELKYFDIVRQQSYLGTIQALIDASQKKLDIVKQQQTAGLANNSDLYQAQLDLNANLQLQQAQELIVDQDKTDLLTLLNLNPDSSIIIHDSIIVDKTLRLDSVLSHLPANPDIEVAREQIRISELLERETSSQRYPAITASGGYNYGRTQSEAGNLLFNQNYGPYLGVGLSIPIFNGGIIRRQEKIASLNTENSKLLKDTLVLSYTSIAVKNWQAYNNNLQQLETQRKNYELSIQLLNLVLLRFQYKQATIVDVNLAQTTFQNAALALVNLSFAAKVAEIQLRKLENRLIY